MPSLLRIASGWRNWLGEAQLSKLAAGCEVIPPGIDTTVFKPQDKNLCRKHLDLPADAFVIITGGASLTDANKNVPWLLEQLSRLPDLDGVIVLAFGEGSRAGSGPFERAVYRGHSRST